MAYPEDVVAVDAGGSTDPTFSTPALAVEALRLSRRREALKAQATAAAQQLGNAPQGQMVGNGGFQHYVAPHWGSQLAPVVATGLNRLDSRQLDKEETTFNQREQEAARAHMARMPRTQNAPGPYGVNVSTEPTDAEKLRWAQEGMMIPSLAPTMKAYLDDQLTKAPERAENRAWRSSEAEANRQSRAEQAEAQREFQRWQTQQNVDIRRELAAGRGRGGGGGGGSSAGPITIDNGDGTTSEIKPWSRRGVKAADIVKEVRSDGTVVLTDKISQEQRVLGERGRPSSTTEKTHADATTSIANAKEGLTILESMKPLFGKATESGLRADIENAIQYGTSYSTDSKAALKDLGIKAANLAKYADRKMFGPQFTDADVKAIKESVGNFEKATSYKERMAAYNSIKEIFERQAKVPATFADDTSNRRAANAPGGAPAAPASAPSIDDRLKKYK